MTRYILPLLICLTACWELPPTDPPYIGPIDSGAPPPVVWHAGDNPGARAQAAWIVYQINTGTVMWVVWWTGAGWLLPEGIPPGHVTHWATAHFPMGPQQ